MGKPSTNAGERAQKTVSGSLASTSNGTGATMPGPFNLWFGGTWSGTAALEASADGGTTYVNCLWPDGSVNAYTRNGLIAVPNIYEDGVLYRVAFTRTSGTLEWRMSC
jgi:hypothetical protein